MTWAGLTWVACERPGTWIAIIPGAYLMLTIGPGRMRSLVVQALGDDRRGEVWIDP